MQPLARHQGRPYGGQGSPPSELAAGCQMKQDGGLAPLAAGVGLHTWALRCREERGCARGSSTLGVCRCGAGGCQAARATWGSSGHSLQKAWLVLLFVVWPELDLALVASKLAGFVEGDRVGTIENVVASLHGKRSHRRGLGSHAALPLLPSAPGRTCIPDRKEVAMKKRSI